MKTADKVAAKVAARGPDDCWLWTGSVTRNGHPQEYFAGRNWSAARLVWTLLRGEVPDGMLVRHVCPSRLCVNPRHLALATVAESVRAMVKTRKPRRKTRRSR
jgi:hypothetical protein